LREALTWDDAVDGRPKTKDEIAAALSILEKRLELPVGWGGRESAAYAFNTTVGGRIWPYRLRSGRCDRSIAPHVIRELGKDAYGVADTPLDRVGDVALDIGGHVGAAALQIASQTSAAFAGVITFEPTRENHFFSQWNMWEHGYHQDRVVCLHTAVSETEALIKIQYSPFDTTGAGAWRPKWRVSGSVDQDCTYNPAHLVRSMALVPGLEDLGVLPPRGGGGGGGELAGALRPPSEPRRVRFVKLDCEG
jgi:FkbM family methyltransferase